MSNITKLLAVIAGLLISFEVAGPTLHAVFFSQLENQRQELTKVTRQLLVKERGLRQAELSVRQFEQRAKLNFEPDVAKARLTYQEYLLRLSDACSLNSVMISSSQPERLEELGYILSFSLQATGTTEQFGKLIDGFYRTEALHRLSHVNIFQSLGPDSPTHSLALDMALLVMDSTSGSPMMLTPPKTHLLHDIFAEHDIFRKRAPGSGVQPDSGLASGMSMLGNLLSSLPAPPPETPVLPQSSAPELPAVPQTTTELPPTADPKTSLRLVGIIAKGPKKVALFCDIVKDVQYSLVERSELNELGIAARITRIETDDVRLVEGDQQIQLALGELYSSAVKQ